MVKKLFKKLKIKNPLLFIGGFLIVLIYFIYWYFFKRESTPQIKKNDYSILPDNTEKKIYSQSQINQFNIIAMSIHKSVNELDIVDWLNPFSNQSGNSIYNINYAVDLINENIEHFSVLSNIYKNNYKITLEQLISTFPAEHQNEIKFS